jgi:hypothetical protein
MRYKDGIRFAQAKPWFSKPMEYSSYIFHRAQQILGVNLHKISQSGETGLSGFHGMPVSDQERALSQRANAVRVRRHAMNLA